MCCNSLTNISISGCASLRRSPRSSTLYKSLTNVWEGYLIVKNFSRKGNLKFKDILFVPKKNSIRWQ